MTFGNPVLLLLVLPPLAWLSLGWRASRRRLNLILKALSLTLIALALAEPRITLPQVKTAVVLLVDTSASIPTADRERALGIVRQIEQAKGRNWLKVIAFDSQPRPFVPQELASNARLERTSATSASGTNLESALTNTMAAVPNRFLPRLVLLSDGNENLGSSARAIAQLQRIHVPVDTIALNGRSASALHLSSVSIPRRAFSSEQIPIAMTVTSPDRSSAAVQIYGEGKLLGSETVELKPGENSLHVHARIKSTGAVSLGVVLKAALKDEARFEQAVELRRAKVLYLSQDPAGSDNNLLAAFHEADFDIDRDARKLDASLAPFQLVVLNNLDLNSLALPQKERLAGYVENGGGLLLIGGERQAFKEDKKLDALDRVLPAKIAPPETPQGNTVALIIDKSSSMEGRKIELARLSAIGVVDHLRPVDSIGVLIFDNSFQWAVPMRRAEDKSLIKRLISGITPDGGTQIAPALAEAYRKVVNSKATYRHVVLLTDGISEEGDSMELAREAALHQVTISTVGLGQDVNRSYLEKVAANSGGRSYFLNEPLGLEQILLKDVQSYSESTAVEQALTPIVAERAEVLDGVGLESAPALKGYARYKAKPGAETLLQIDGQKKDPLYVRWQYGLGRAAVFASDAKSRWAENWISWVGFDKFWTNVSRDLLMHASPMESSADFDAATGDVIVHYRLSAALPEPDPLPALYLLGADNFREALELQRVASHVYEGRAHVGNATGLFRIRPLDDASPFAEIGFFREQPELQDYGSNDQLLRQVSSLTNGRFNPAPDSIFAGDGRKMYAVWQLWPACLALAIALSIAELVVRKWSGLVYRFRGA